MTELITHEVQITTVDGRCRHQTNHLMQCQAAMNNIVLVSFLHMPIHIGINQAEDNRLVTHQSLIMTFGV